MDECRAKCNDESLDIWFECDCPLNKYKCEAKCKHMYDEKNCIPHHHIIKEKEVVFMHTPSVHLYHKLYQNGEKIDVLNGKMNFNTIMNLKQGKALHRQGHMLGKVLHNQAHDAMRDYKHMKAHKMAALQRKDIMMQASDNGQGIAANGAKADALLAGQEMLKDAHGYTQNQLKALKGDVLTNQGMIADVGSQVYQHRADFANYKKDFDDHVMASKVHDAKQDGLIADFHAHDVKQDGLIADFKVHDAKQDALIADHAQTQDMLAKQMAVTAAHIDRQDAFNAEQRGFNDKVDYHMKDEQNHMHDQDHEMMAAAHHRSHERHHMAHHDHGHYHYGHAHPVYKTKTVLKKKKKAVVVIPKEAKVFEKTVIEPETRLYEVGHYHHGHGHGHSHGYGHGYSHGHGHM